MQLDPIAIGVGVRLVARDEIPSTNKEARAHVRRDHPVWVTAVTQTAGRGRHGRRWISPKGNLYASLALVDPAPVERSAELAFVTALALRDAVVAEAPALAPKLAFKWPNDLLLADNKCAGILIEGEVHRDHSGHVSGPIVVIGIGVNCVSHPHEYDLALSENREEVPYPPTDLRAHGADITAEALFRRLSATMCRRIAQWDSGNGFAAILGEWVACARGIGEEITVFKGVDSGLGRGKVGRFLGLDQSGRLLLELPNGEIEKIAAGDVFLFNLRDESRTVPSGPG
jgi:BirA family transcriptional regulator, biotin operon repressor / biotin---[acetyl-CoA-carboxylase] ligase